MIHESHLIFGEGTADIKLGVCFRFDIVNYGEYSKIVLIVSNKSSSDLTLKSDVTRALCHCTKNEDLY